MIQKRKRRPRKSSERTVPDDLRRRDQAEQRPDALAQSGDEVPTAPHSPAPDGGAADHPVHDEPVEDFTPRDYERQIEEIAETARERQRRNSDDER